MTKPSRSSRLIASTTGIRLTHDGKLLIAAATTATVFVDVQKMIDGAADAVVGTILGMNHEFLPPTINYAEPDPECDLNYIPNHSVERSTAVALCNCIGFGSKNSALVVARGESV